MPRPRFSLLHLEFKMSLLFRIKMPSEACHPQGHSRYGYVTILQYKGVTQNIDPWLGNVSARRFPSNVRLSEKEPPEASLLLFAVFHHEPF
jgi:hypothetical protein